MCHTFHISVIDGDRDMFESLHKACMLKCGPNHGDKTVHAPKACFDLALLTRQASSSHVQTAVTCSSSYSRSAGLFVLVSCKGSGFCTVSAATDKAEVLSVYDGKPDCDWRYKEVSDASKWASQAGSTVNRLVLFLCQLQHPPHCEIGCSKTPIIVAVTVRWDFIVLVGKFALEITTSAQIKNMFVMLWFFFLSLIFFGRNIIQTGTMSHFLHFLPSSRVISWPPRAFMSLSSQSSAWKYKLNNDQHKDSCSSCTHTSG